MKLGVVFPTCEIGADPFVIRDFAQTAEELGYDYILTYDHVLGAVHERREPPLADPYTERDPFHEPFTLFSYLAGLTRRIEFATGVLILPQRQTALVAKQAAQLDLLCQGRLRLGVGTGWNWVEYESLGQDFARRGRRFDEQVALLRALWSEELVDFDGEFHRVDRANLLPRPRRPIPIWFGGFTAPAIRRAARLGDGFVFGAASAPMQELCKRLRGLLREAGRRDSEFGIETIVPFGAGPDSWAARRREWEALGATHLCVRAMDTGAALMGEPLAELATPRDHIAALEPFIRAIR